MTARVAVVGVGRVGAVTAVGLSHLGAEVLGVDRSPSRVAQLRSGRVAEMEPGLRAALKSAGRFRNLTFETGPSGGDFDFVFLCVDTPPLPTLEPDLTQVFAAAEEAVPLLRPGGILVTRSTVPVGTGDRVEALLAEAGRPDVPVVHIPEFLREGRAWEDFRTPDRIVIGANAPEASRAAAGLFASLPCPRIEVDRRTSELSKYAANAYLATSISFANELADLCGAVGVEAEAVFDILRADSRIGRQAYLSPGLGFGGHCLPKDTAALEYLGLVHGLSMTQLSATREVNGRRSARVVAWLRDVLGGLIGRRVAILGLAFKPNTDDLRESPSLHLARMLGLERATVTGWDPLVQPDVPFLQRAGCMDEALEGADALVIAHAWPGWRSLNPVAVAPLMRRLVVYDAPGVLDRSAWRDAGFATRFNAGRAVEA